jgi:preprotein translocase SecE subunit
MAKPIQTSKILAGDIAGELKKVSWPTREQTMRLTFIVIFISLIIGSYIGIIDFLLAKGLEYMTTLR